MAHNLFDALRREFNDALADTLPTDTGRVIESGDGVFQVAGLSKTASQELLEIDTAKGKILGLASSLDEFSIGAIVLGAGDAVRVGDRVKGTGVTLSLPVGEELIGRVIDPLGRPLDGRGEFEASKMKQYPLERNAPSVVARESVSVPLHTGIMAVDAMIPIGRGQRELIIGDRQTGKTAIAIDTILNQRHEGGKRVVCIYVAIGQKQSKVAETVELLRASGALEYTVVVSAPASAPASLQYLAPFAGCAVGEFFMDNGEDALVIYDDLSKHAVSYRELSLLLRRPPGREAYPGDIFFLHSRLLERSARLSYEHGGGSLTALPIIETQLGDVSAYIPTNVISITDGQIYLESTLFHQGIRPAINVGLSVSRVGSAAQTKAIKKVAGKLRLELAQFRELAAFAQFASDLDAHTRAKIVRGKLLTEVLKQSDRAPLSMPIMVAQLYAALNGHFAEVPESRVREAMTALETILEREHQPLLSVIGTERAVSEESEAGMVAVIREVVSSFGFSDTK